MWPFKKKTPSEPVVKYEREVTFLASNIVQGKAFTAQAGVQEGPAGLYSPWVHIEGLNGGTYIFPRRVPMSRKRAEQAARLLGTGIEVVALLSRDELLEFENDRSNGRNEV